MSSSLSLELGASVPEVGPHTRRLDGRLTDQFMGLLVGLISVSVVLKVAQLPDCGWYTRVAGDTLMLGAAGGAEVFGATGAVEDEVAGLVAEGRVVGVACAVGVGEAEGLADGLVPIPDADALLAVTAEVLVTGSDRPVHDERAPVE